MSSAEADEYVSLGDALKSVPLAEIEKVIATAIGTRLKKNIECNISELEVNFVKGTTMAITIREAASSDIF